MVKVAATLLLSALLCSACEHGSQASRSSAPPAQATEAAPKFAASEVVRSVATEERTLSTVRIQLDPELLCDPCTEFITETLGKEPGVASVDVNQETGLVTVAYRAALEKGAFDGKVKRLPQYTASAAPTIVW